MGVRKQILPGWGVVLLALLLLCSCNSSEQDIQVKNTDPGYVPSPGISSSGSEDVGAFTIKDRKYETMTAVNEPGSEPEKPELESESDYEVFIPDDPAAEVDHTNPGSWSETEAFDVDGSFLPDEEKGYQPNVNISETITLKKFESKTWTVDIGRGWRNAAQDTVMIEIINETGMKFRYISEDASEKQELANFSSIEGLNRVLSNLDPEHKYEITIINLETVPMKLEIRIISFDSDQGVFVTP